MAEAGALSREPREIDYRLRPAKNVERKLLVELAGRLGRVAEPLRKYRYAGMGSIYFSDFALFHRRFGMSEMVSLEGRDALVARCEYNRPFDCIDVRSSDVASALPELREGPPTILWLDYDSKLDQNRLDEIRVACDVLACPSLILVTVNVTPDEEEDRVNKFRERFGSRASAEVTEPIHLNRKRLPALSYEYLASDIGEAIRSRAQIDGTRYRQLVHFLYEDGALMLTVGGILYSPDQEKAIERCGFEDLIFYRPGAEAFEIVVPKLTHRERVELDRLLPDGRLDEAPAELSREDVDHYAEIYRQVPIYVDAEI